MPSFTIKKAKKSDLETLYQLVKELATYEKNNPNKISKDNIEKFGFGQNRIFHAYLCKSEDEYIGYSLHHYKFLGFCTTAVLVLEDLYVKPEFRNKGAATVMINNLENIAKEFGCDHMEWIAFKWNKLANDFYLNIAERKELNEQFYEWKVEL